MVVGKSMFVRLNRDMFWSSWVLNLKYFYFNVIKSNGHKKVKKKLKKINS